VVTFALFLVGICLLLAADMETGEIGVMNEPKLRNSTAVDKALAIPSVGAALNGNDKDGKQAQADKPAQDARPRVEITADSTGKYIQGISAKSCGEIDALIGDLRGLREKLVADGGRVQQSIVEFTAFNQSIVKLAEVVSDSVTHVRAPSH
jgi:hypothetical protein